MKTTSFCVALSATLSFCAAAPPTPVHPGSFDASFDPTQNGHLLGPAQCAAPIRCLVRQDDGKLVIGGQFIGVDNTPRNCVARLNADGTLDRFFDSGAGLDGAVTGLALQSDGKMLAVGNFCFADRMNVDGLVRLNRNGSIDRTFQPRIGRYVNCVALQPDGRILVGGSFTNVAGNARIGIARLNSDGSFDSTFNAAGAVTNSQYGVTCIRVQEDGRIVVAGFPRALNQPLLRLNSDGSLDPAFHIPTIQQMPFIGWVVDLAIDSHGRILLSGRFTQVNGVNRAGVARLLLDGSLDAHFLPPMISAANDVNIASLTLQSNGVAIGGNFTNIGGRLCAGIARLLDDGSFDAAFEPPRLFPDAAETWVHTLVSAAGGQLLVGAGIDSFGACSSVPPLCRLNADGQLDESFHIPSLPGPAEIRTLTVRRDGRILVGLGTGDSFNGQSRSPVALLNPDGTLDARFNPPLVGPAAYAITALADGRILVGGPPMTVGSSALLGLFRLLPDGRLDPGFRLEELNESGPFISGITLQKDEKAIVTGNFQTLRGVERRLIARLNPNGSLDKSFALDPALVPDMDDDAPIGPVAVQHDGKILIGGMFLDRGNQLLRLLPNGALDESFPPYRTVVQKIIVQPDNRILVLGRTWENASPILITRLNPDGTIDRVFDTQPWYQADDMVLQADGKVIVALTCPQTALIRFHADGSRDPTFSASVRSGMSDAWIHALVLQPDGRVLIAGQFTSVDGITTHGIARLQNDCARSCRLRAAFDPRGRVKLVLDSAPGEQVMIEASEDLVNWHPFAAVTNAFGSVELLDPDSPGLPRRFYRATLP